MFWQARIHLPYNNDNKRLQRFASSNYAKCVGSVENLAESFATQKATRIPNKITAHKSKLHDFVIYGFNQYKTLDNKSLIYLEHLKINWN